MLGVKVRFAVLGDPLERGMGLGHECREGNSYLGCLSGFSAFDTHFFYQVDNFVDIIHRFPGEAEHKIEFYPRPVLLEGEQRRPQELFFGDIFVNPMPQLLAAGLGCEGKPGLFLGW